MFRSEEVLRDGGSSADETRADGSGKGLVVEEESVAHHGAVRVFLMKLLEIL